MNIKERLLELHREEKLMNIALSNVDAEIKQLKKRKLKIAERISKNMKYRNKLINEL